jgi:LemA protein
MMRRSLWIASGVTVVVVMAGLLVYGSYISAQYQMEALQTAAHEQWVQLDGALRRWAGETSQLEAAVAPAAKSNPMALRAVASARKTLLQSRDPKAVAEAGRALDEALNAVMAMGMSDPQVKSDAKFEAARERLRALQRRIEQDRDRYNESLRNYDLFVGEFPNGMWAKIAGFQPDRRFFPKF